MARGSQRNLLARRSFSAGSGITIGLDDFPGQIDRALKGKLQSEFDGIMADVRSAQFDAAQVIANRAKEAMRGDMASAGFRNASKLSKTWRAKAYAKSRSNNDEGAQAVVWSSAPAIVAAFDDGGAIQAYGDRYLQIPFGRAKAIYRQSRSWKGAGRRSDVTGRFKKSQPWIPQVEARLRVTIKPIFSKNKRTAVLVADTGGKSRAGFTGAGNVKKEVLGFLVKEVQPGKRFRGRELLKQLLTAGETHMPEEFQKAYFTRRAARGDAS